MKITFLGTGAIAYPLPFCNCDNCKEARRRGGKSLRNKSSILVNDDLIIDLNSDVPIAMNTYNKDIGKVRYLLQTHVHTDHFDPTLLSNRVKYTIDKKQEILNIYAHPLSLKYMSDKVYEYENLNLMSCKDCLKLDVKCNKINSGDIINIDRYNIKAIDCDHDLINGSLLYIINDNDKSILYATDTSLFTNLALEQMKNIKFDLVIMDHTFGDNDYYFKHLNNDLFIKQINKLKEINCINDNTRIYATHISHDGNKYHELMEEKAIKEGYYVAYDGLEVNI